QQPSELALILRNASAFDCLRVAIACLSTWRSGKVCRFVDADGLTSYGSSITEAHRQLLSTQDEYARAKSRPISRSCSRTFFDPVIISRPREALGPTVPQSILARADDVIQ